MDRLANNKTDFCLNEKLDLWIFAARWGYAEMEKRLFPECKKAILKKLSGENGVQEMLDEGIPPALWGRIIQNLAQTELRQIEILESALSRFQKEVDDHPESDSNSDDEEYW